MPRRNKYNLTKRLNKLERNSRPEVKYTDRSSSEFDTVGSVTGTIIQPQVLAQGNARNNRIGDKVKSRNIRFQAIIKMPSVPTSPTCAVRLLVLRAKFSNPTTSDMPSWFGSVDEDKFFVIRDHLTQVSWMGVGDNQPNATGSTLKKFKFNISTSMRKLQYDGSNAQSPLNNEYVIYMLAENQSAEVAYHFQHYYIDN